METTARVAGGRVVVPEEVVRALGLVEGSLVLITVNGGRAALTGVPGPAPQSWARP
ncbi:MAG: AbrB/MazE/SpoVT family DNA-binding domain-containing protein, partial [Acidimicrobiales bacterium]